MTYDSATGSAVLFAARWPQRDWRLPADTWTWNGTHLDPAGSRVSARPARDGAAMAYDVATGNVMLFGGNDLSGFPNDTWTWG